jgi:hypothetical protein
VVLQGQKSPEKGHETVAEELIHGALVAVDGVRHQPQEPVHELVHGLRVQLLSQLGGVHDIAKEHSHLFALTFEGTTRG